MRVGLRGDEGRITDSGNVPEPAFVKMRQIDQNPQSVAGSRLGDGNLKLVLFVPSCSTIPHEIICHVSFWEGSMPDDKHKRGASDRSKVAGGQAYEVRDFSKKHGITRDQAQRLIKRLGKNRKKLDEAATKLKAR